MFLGLGLVYLSLARVVGVVGVFQPALGLLVSRTYWLLRLFLRSVLR